MSRVIKPGPLVGAIAHRRELRGFSITETTYAPGLVISKHSHRFPYFCAVLEGSFDDAVGSHNRSCARSSVFFRPAEQVHADKFESRGARCLAVEFQPNFLDEIDRPKKLLKDSNFFSGGLIFALHCRLRAEFQKWDDFSALTAEGLVYELLAEAFRSPTASTGSTPAWLRPVMEMLSNSHIEGQTLSTLAESVHIHPTHLSRVFRKNFGCSMGEYIRKIRIHRCCSELLDREKPLITIALEAGFADQSHFCRVFKRVMGESPAAYRHRMVGSVC